MDILELADLEARLASGTGAPVDISNLEASTDIRAQLNVTAENDAATAETLDVVIEDSLDDGATWNVIGTFTQATGVTRQVIAIAAPFAGLLRARWTIGGTVGPSFTFAVHAALIPARPV